MLFVLTKQCTFENMATTSKIGEKKTIIGRAREFLTESNGSQNSYKCKLCERVLNGKSSSNLIAHFKKFHERVYYEKIGSESEENIQLQRLKLVHSCVELVTINSHSFSTLSQSGFRNAIEPTCRKLQLAGCGLNFSDHHVYEIKEKVRETAKKIKDQITSEVKDKIIAVMVDAATRNGRSIFGISIQYRVNGVLKLIAIGMRELKKSHTADYLADVLRQVLNEYGITMAQVLTITTDNGSDVLAMVRDFEQHLCDDDSDEDIQQFLNKNRSNDEMLDMLLDESDYYEQLIDKIVSDIHNKNTNHNSFVYSIKCAAHTMQLAVKDSFQLIDEPDKNVIDLCRHVATFLRKQSCRNEMRRLGLSCILPSLDVKTRWSSTYLMVNISLNLLFLQLATFFLIPLVRFCYRSAMFRSVRKS